jgi:hypothetical protein
MSQKQGQNKSKKEGGMKTKDDKKPNRKKGKRNKTR